MNIIAWTRVAWPIWLTFAICYFWIVFSFFSGEVSFAASGAVLVSGSVASDLLLHRFIWRRYREQPFDSIVSNVQSTGDLPNEIRLNVIQARSAGSERLRDQMRALKRVSKIDHYRNSETNPDKHSSDLNGWVYTETADYVSNRLSWFIGISAFIGSMIWAYSPH